MKRRVLAVIISIVMLMSLTACESDGSVNNDMFRYQTQQNLLNNPTVKFGGLLK